MDIKKAADILRAKVETPEEKLALATLVHEMDMQFCLGWGAGVSALGDMVMDHPLRKRENHARKSRWLGELCSIVSGKPNIETFRGEDFIPTGIYSEWLNNEAAQKEMEEFPF